MWAKSDCPHAHLWKREGREEYYFMIKIHTLNLCVELFGLAFIFLHSAGIICMLGISSHQQTLYLLSFNTKPSKVNVIRLILLNNTYCHMPKSLKKRDLILYSEASSET